MAGALSDDVCLMSYVYMSDVCLSDVCRVHRPKSRTERPRKTEIDTEVARITGDWDTTFKNKRSKVKVTRPLYSQWEWNLLLRCRLQARSARRRKALRRPQMEEGRGHIVAAACLQLVIFLLTKKWTPKKDTSTGLGNPGCMLASKRSCHLKLKLALLSLVILMRIYFCFHTRAVHMQIHLPCCVYAESSMEFQSFEVKPEDDCPHDDKPSTGMFAASVAALSALTSCWGSVVSCGSV